jgi:hypothetical protein
LQQNFGGMMLGWPPSKILSGDPDFQPFQTRRFLWEFPIWFYVKLSSAVAAILVRGMKCRTQFWKGTTQGSSQQSLVTSNQDGRQAKNRKKGG